MDDCVSRSTTTQQLHLQLSGLLLGVLVTVMGARQFSRDVLMQRREAEAGVSRSVLIAPVSFPAGCRLRPCHVNSATCKAPAGLRLRMITVATHLTCPLWRARMPAPWVSMRHDLPARIGWFESVSQCSAQLEKRSLRLSPILAVRFCRCTSLQRTCCFSLISWS